MPGAPCRICAGTKGSRFEKHGYSWLRCAGCAAVTKILSAEEYGALKPTYDPGLLLKLHDRDKLLPILEPEVASRRRRIAATMRHVGRGDLSGAAFLDVGCGMGASLMAARELGMDVLGFEPSAGHAHIAADILGLPVERDYFSVEALRGRTFDLILLTQVIEHIYDPGAFVRALLSVLRPGGVLQVATPNTRGLTARLVGADWPMLRPVDHVSLISSKAYSHFNLPPEAWIHHTSSEQVFDFAATLASVARERLRRRGREGVPATAPAAFAQATTGGAMVARGRRRGLQRIAALLSWPVFVLGMATKRGACLVSTIVMDADDGRYAKLGFERCRCRPAKSKS